MQGCSQDFSKGGGGGGHTASNIIVMAFSPRNIVGCLLKKRLTKGGGRVTLCQTLSSSPLSFSPRNIVGCFLKKSLTKGGEVTLCQTLSSWRFRHGIL